MVLVRLGVRGRGRAWVRVRVRSASSACSGSLLLCGRTLSRLALAAKRSVESVSPWLGLGVAVG